MSNHELYSVICEFESCSGAGCGERRERDNTTAQNPSKQIQPVAEINSNIKELTLSEEQDDEDKKQARRAEW